MVIHIDFLFFLRTSSVGGGVFFRTFLLFSFSCSADHERDWPPCKSNFYGLATNTLNVGNILRRSRCVNFFL